MCPKKWARHCKNTADDYMRWALNWQVMHAEKMSNRKSSCVRDSLIQATHHTEGTTYHTPNTPNGWFGGTPNLLFWETLIFEHTWISKPFVRPRHSEQWWTLFDRLVRPLDWCCQFSETCSWTDWTWLLVPDDDPRTGLQVRPSYNLKHLRCVSTTGG